jgi:hypothetical protein
LKPKGSRYLAYTTTSASAALWLALIALSFVTRWAPDWFVLAVSLAGALSLADAAAVGYLESRTALSMHALLHYLLGFLFVVAFAALMLFWHTQTLVPAVALLAGVYVNALDGSVSMTTLDALDAMDSRAEVGRDADG